MESSSSALQDAIIAETLDLMQSTFDHIEHLNYNMTSMQKELKLQQNLINCLQIRIDKSKLSLESSSNKLIAMGVNEPILPFPSISTDSCISELV